MVGVMGVRVPQHHHARESSHGGAGEAGSRSQGAAIELWTTLLRTHEALVRRVETDLVEEHDMPLASYEVLSALAKVPGNRLRMNELADRVPMSRSGVTRLVDRLQRDGLVVRSTCSHDARGTYAVLTRTGYDRVVAARKTYHAGVDNHCASKLTREEVTELITVLGKLLPRQNPDEDGAR